MTKQELRKVFTAKRNALSIEELQDLSAKIATRFFQHFTPSEAGVIHTFLPILKTREPDTWRIIDKLKQDYPLVKIAVPRVNPASGELENFFLENQDQLTTSTWGIPEPSTGVPVQTRTFGIILVPLLAFDKKGNRVGYGRGFYDKFLRRCEPSAKKVGLSFFGPVESVDDADAFDQPLDYCITPEGLISFKKQ